jgi:hypothetical protein
MQFITGNKLRDIFETNPTKYSKEVGKKKVEKSFYLQ